ncbi:hypothetical protein CR513_14381, partial [Mucuna pruriens]
MPLRFRGTLTHGGVMIVPPLERCASSIIHREIPNFRGKMSSTSSSETSSTYSSSSSSSSLGSKALEAMPIAVAEGASSQAPAFVAPAANPLAWVHQDVLDKHSEMTRFEVASLSEEGKWVRQPYAH